MYFKTDEGSQLSQFMKGKVKKLSDNPQTNRDDLVGFNYDQGHGLDSFNQRLAE